MHIQIRPMGDGLFAQQVRTDSHRVLQTSLCLMLFDPDVSVFEVRAVSRLSQVLDRLSDGLASDDPDSLQQVKPDAEGDRLSAIDTAADPRKRRPESRRLGGMYPDFVQTHLRGALRRSVRAQYGVGIAA